MSSVPDPDHVKPWYLRNITEALALDDASGNVYVRTGFEGDIIITGNVSIPGTVTVNSSAEDPVHVHVDEIGTSGILNVPYMPIGGNVVITSGNIDANVHGNVGILSMPNVNASITGNVIVSSGNIDANVHGNVGILGNVNIGTMPEVEIKNDTGNPIPISATTATNSALNPIYIAGSVTSVGTVANQGKLWFFQIAQGLIPGHIPLFKAGYNPSVANNSEESIWAHSELYPWSAWGAGGTLSCVSASASDVGTLEIVGLRASDWVEITETVTMTGVTPVVTTNSFIRVNNVHYSHTSSNVGEVHLNRNGTCVAHIDAGNGQGQMAQYTVPAGHTAYLLTGNANLGKGNDGTGKFRYRLYGSSFQTAMTFLLFQSTFNYTFEAPLALPEKTDLDVTLIASVSGTAVTCAYSMILIAN